MRRTVIRSLLPLFFCLAPLLGGLLVARAVPPKAQEFYLEHLRTSSIDWIILGSGSALFITQLILCWRALRWRGTGFDERPDRWLTHLAQAAEWFPLLGLIGTVAGIMQTFSQTTSGMAPEVIIKNYAPAITATGSGLFMALFNILPSWVVLVGRDLILALSGGDGSASGETHP